MLPGINNLIFLYIPWNLNVTKNIKHCKTTFIVPATFQGIRSNLARHWKQTFEKLLLKYLENSFFLY